MEPVPKVDGRSPRALLVVRNPFVHDARVLRAAKTLESLGCEPTVVAAIGSDDAPRRELRDGVRVERVGPPRALARVARGPLGWLRAPGSAGAGTATGTATGSSRSGRAGRSALRMLIRWLTALDFYLRGVAAARRIRPDLVHCNDYNTMWIGVACRLMFGSAVIYDSHELWPDRNMRPEARPWLVLCEALFVRVADRVVMTSPAHAEVMARRYRIAEPIVVRNIPDRATELARPEDAPELAPTAAASDNGGSAAVAAYVGVLLENRGLEQAIRAVGQTPRTRLRLIGPIAPAYRAALEAEATRAAVADRVEFADPVPPTEVVRALSGADVGLALFQPTCLSHRLVLPNKLFEYALAGVPVLGSDLPMIARFVHEHGLGQTVDPDDVQAIAGALSELLEPERNRELRAAAARAGAGLDWRRERRLLAAVYREALTAAPA